MTEQTTPQYSHFYPGPAPTKKAWWKKSILLASSAALLVGLGVGAAISPEPKAVEVIKEVPGPERTVTKEVKVNVPTTPSSCTRYITLSEQAFDISSEAMGYAAKLNSSGINAQTEKLKAIAPEMLSAKAACRAS